VWLPRRVGGVSRAIAQAEPRTVSEGFLEPAIVISGVRLDPDGSLRCNFAAAGVTGLDVASVFPP